MTEEEDDSPDESFAYPIDAELSNADWPKSIPDTQKDIQDRLDAYPPGRSFIHGGNWFIWFDYETMDWASDSESPLEIIREHFNAAKVDEYIQADKTLVELYQDAADYLTAWGVKASVVD